MPLLTPGAIERLRRVNVSTLKDLAVVERPTVTSGALGANAGGQSWAVVDGTDETPIACRMSPLGAGNPTEADQAVALNRWLVAFDLGGPAIAAGYRLTISGLDLLKNPYTRRVIVLSEQTPRTTSAMRIYVGEDAGPGRRR